ncbi:SDR family oxidoreductase [Rhodococcus sp. MS16]|uniref:SDR family NAD(P)-dependent oxidoreductase n=1 Tax=Rhodococcus sp. MS16 TaxID=2579941 RepID=UPI00156267A1|nr:SDR family NAD(P)-dependent oxidoreductase [Rhodococcus sp. MS16]NRI70059.1 SDR family oxidoreductase [Rhodococcus sp. MS16]
MKIDSTSAIVTGGASGLGLAVARVLAAAGARPVIVDMNADLGESVARENGFTFARADVSSESDVAEAIATAQEVGPLRVIVNAAGISRSTRTVARDLTPLPLDEFEAHVRVNLIGTFNVCRLGAAAMGGLDAMADGSRGAIVNFASIAAFEGQVGQVSYSASKGGVVGMTLPLARDLSVLGVRVNTVVPGLIDTPIYGEGPEAEEFKAKLGRDVLFPKRLGKPEELASVVRELVLNDYMNGEVVRVDGGVRLPWK